MNSQMKAVELELDSDDDVAHFAFDGLGRLVLDTVHGQIIIDIRAHDVNAFTVMGGRKDHALITIDLPCEHCGADAGEDHDEACPTRADHGQR